MRVQQLVEQHRIARQLLGDPRAGRTQAHQLRQRIWILAQQRQIGRPPQYRLNQRQDALQHSAGIVLAGLLGVARRRAQRLQQWRHQCIEAIKADALHALHCT